MKRFFNIVDQIEKFILVWGILSLALMGFIQVLSRYLLNYSFTWFEELGRYLGIFLTFAGAATGVKTSSHFSMNFIILKMNPFWQLIIKTFSSLLAAGFFFIVTWYSCEVIIQAYGFKTTSPITQIPMYITYIPIPLFSLLMGSRYLFQAINRFMNKI